MFGMGLVAVKLRFVKLPLLWQGWRVMDGSGMCYVSVCVPYVCAWLWGHWFGMGLGGGKGDWGVAGLFAVKLRVGTFPF